MDAMRKMSTWNCVLTLLFLVTSAYGYDVVLKNGKVVKGDLVSKDDSMIVLKDASGVKIQLKSSTVDLTKTDTANPKPAPEAKSSAAPATTAAKSKTPAKKYTLQDLEQLREKYNLGESAAGDDSAVEGEDQSTNENASTEGEAGEKKPTSADEDAAAKAAAQKQKKAEALQKKIEDTQKVYDSLSQQCSYLKTTNFQTTTLKDDKGNVLPYYDTIKKTCDEADKAKAIIDQANAELAQLGQ